MVTLLARVVHGLEWVLAAEVAALPGAADLALDRREVRFRGDPVDALGLRTADDVFAEVGVAGNVPAGERLLPAFARSVRDLDWSGTPRAGTFDVVAGLEGRHTYNRYALERAVGTALAPVLGARFLERTPAGLSGGSELTVRVFARRGSATVAVRLGREPAGPLAKPAAGPPPGAGPGPLHRRAYKLAAGPGTLHPPVAAALALIGAPPAGTVLDPFCGDGTIAIETALLRPDLSVRGTDLDPERVEAARANAARAGVAVALSTADAAAGAAADAVLTNPPWRRAVDWGGGLAGRPERFWAALDTRVLACLTDEPPPVGGVTLDQRLRLAGRVVHLTLAGAPLPADLATWRDRAIAAGVTTAGGF